MPLGANKVALFGASADTGSAVLLSTATASSSASLSFTLPTAYKQVKFGFYNITPATDNVAFQFQMSTDSGSSYATTVTTTIFIAEHNEADSYSALSYRTGDDLAQSTSMMSIAPYIDNASDASTSGELTVYNPASTTYVKHFYSRMPTLANGDYAFDTFYAGYGNTTSAVDACKFAMSSGNIASGTIKMWGIK